MVLIGPIFPLRRLGWVWRIRRRRRLLLLCLLFLFFGWCVSSAWRQANKRRLWSSFFFLTGAGLTLVMKPGNISDCNLHILFHQMGDFHCEWRILNNIRLELLDEFLLLGKAIISQVYNLRDDASSDDLAHKHFYSLIDRFFLLWKLRDW